MRVVRHENPYVQAFYDISDISRREWLPHSRALMTGISLIQTDEVGELCHVRK